MKAVIHGITPSISVIPALDIRTNPPPVNQVGRSTVEKSAASSSSSRFSFRLPLRSLWPRGEIRNNNRYGGLALDDAVLVENGDGETVNTKSPEGQNGSWVMKILQGQGRSVDDRKSEFDGEEDCEVCRVGDDDDQNDVGFDRDSFSRFLGRVSMAETKFYAQISYLGDLAYCIPKLKRGNLLKYKGLRFVTSSLEKKELAAKAEKEQGLVTEMSNEDVMEGDRKSTGDHVSVSTAYQIATSVASYLHSHTKSIGPFKSSKSEADEGSENTCNVNELSLEMASFMATTDSVTAVVAAKEEVKQAVANELNSTLLSPCEWFICDDDQSATRFFVIQGSESLASWQANLLFEPIQFEGLDVLVHRGIYEAAKGMYEQMLPEVRAHLKSRGKHATFRFTGHSLGGSLSLLVNLMLLIRGEVPRSSLLPVIMFGAPSIMCGGDRLLEKLGLPSSHVQAIMMHRDIVPRAFSCSYPNHVAELLKAVNGNFRNHPCLKNQKQLYAPMGELLILQPDEKFSPHHHLLPLGSGLYILNCPLVDTNDGNKQLQAAKAVFINSPHPLEILSDRSAYGSEGTIRRDHDMNSYLKSVRSVIRQELNQIRKSKREQHPKIWWPLVNPLGINAGVIAGSPVPISRGQYEFNFSGILQTGTKSFKRFSRLVTSQHMHLFIMFMFPARLVLLGESVLLY